MKGNVFCIADLIKQPLTVQVSFGGLINADKILVLSPHHDDEILGCGGTLLRYMEKSARISVIYFTDGRYGVLGGDAQQRQLEAESVWERYPDVKKHFWGYEDAKLSSRIDELVGRVKAFIEEETPDIIFTPWLLDAHKDHESVGICLAKALQTGSIADCIVACYEVAYPLYANHTVNITKQIDKKLELLELYKSQLGYLNIKEFIYSLNCYRAQVLRFKSIKAAEGFFVSAKDSYIDFVESLYGEA